MRLCLLNNIFRVIYGTMYIYYVKVMYYSMGHELEI